MIDSRVIGLLGEALFALPPFRGLAITVLYNRQNKSFYPFMTMPGTRLSASQNLNTFVQPVNKKSGGDTITDYVQLVDSVNNTAPKISYELLFGDALFQHQLLKPIRDVLNEFSGFLNVIGLGNAPLVQTMNSIQETLYPGKEATWAIIDYLGHFWSRVSFDNMEFEIDDLSSDGNIKNFRVKLTATYITDFDVSSAYPNAGPI